MRDWQLNPQQPTLPVFCHHLLHFSMSHMCQAGWVDAACVGVRDMKIGLRSSYLGLNGSWQTKSLWVTLWGWIAVPEADSILAKCNPMGIHFNTQGINPDIKFSLFQVLILCLLQECVYCGLLFLVKWLQ